MYLDGALAVGATVVGGTMTFVAADMVQHYYGTGPSIGTGVGVAALVGLYYKVSPRSRRHEAALSSQQDRAQLLDRARVDRDAAWASYQASPDMDGWDRYQYAEGWVNYHSALLVGGTAPEEPQLPARRPTSVDD
jgi:hypothetical protein